MSRQLQLTNLRMEYRLFIHNCSLTILQSFIFSSNIYSLVSYGLRLINDNISIALYLLGYNGVSHFYVFCKRCQTIRPGKLRARCSRCKESSVTLARVSFTNLMIYDYKYVRMIYLCITWLLI